MSLRAGRMIVKTPDSRETSAKRVVVALDTWVPAYWLDHTEVLDDALDALVEAWLAIGQRLTSQGEKVTLVLVARAEDGALRPELVASRASHAHALDAGAGRVAGGHPHRGRARLRRPRGRARREEPEEVAFDNAIVSRCASPRPRCRASRARRRGSSTIRTRRSARPRAASCSRGSTSTTRGASSRRASSSSARCCSRTRWGARRTASARG